MTLANARELRKNATDSERLLWQHLRAHRLQGFKFKRQQPLGLYIADFVCFEARLIVEADGGHHAEQAEYDTRRDDWLRSQGFTVLRFWNNDILTNIEGVLENILEGCRNLSAPSPQPLPRRGGGAMESVPIEGVAATSNGAVSSTNLAGEKSQESSSNAEISIPPLPLWERCRGRGGEG